MSSTLRVESAANDLPILICLSVKTRLRPPFLPLALAASSPALVRSRIKSRSNSAIAPKMSFSEDDCINQKRSSATSEDGFNMTWFFLKHSYMKALTNPRQLKSGFFHKPITLSLQKVNRFWKSNGGHHAKHAMNCTSGIWQSMSSSSGTKLVFDSGVESSIFCGLWWSHLLKMTLWEIFPWV